MSFLCNELFSPVKKADNGYSCHCHHNRKQNAVYCRIKTKLQPSCLRPQHRHKICRNMPKNCHGKLPCFFQHKRKKQSDHRRIQKLHQIDMHDTKDKCSTDQCRCHAKIKLQTLVHHTAEQQFFCDWNHKAGTEQFKHNRSRKKGLVCLLKPLRHLH